MLIDILFIVLLELVPECTVESWSDYSYESLKSRSVRETNGSPLHVSRDRSGKDVYIYFVIVCFCFHSTNGSLIVGLQEGSYTPYESLSGVRSGIIGTVKYI